MQLCQVGVKAAKPVTQATTHASNFLRGAGHPHYRLRPVAAALVDEHPDMLAVDDELEVRQRLLKGEVVLPILELLGWGCRAC